MPVPERAFKSKHSTIRHAEWRRFATQWKQANKATYALVFGTRIAGHEIGALASADPDRLLSSAFPSVPDLRLFGHVSLADGVRRFAEAEGSWARMAIPHLVAEFNSYLAASVGILVEDGVLPLLENHELHELKPHELWTAIREEASIPIDSDLDALGAFISRIRNDLVHRGGLASEGLVANWRDLPTSATDLWEAAAQTTVVLKAKKPLVLGLPEVRGALTVLHRLALSLNEGLGRKVSVETWTRVLVREYVEEHRTYYQTHDAARGRAHALKVIRELAPSLGLTQADLIDYLPIRPNHRARRRMAADEKAAAKKRLQAQRARNRVVRSP